jgi:hypothetical protein
MEQQSFSVVPVTIQAGQAVSNTIDLGGLQALAIVVPAGWTAAGIAFKTSAYGPDEQRLVNLNGTDRPFAMQPVINDTGTEATISAVASKTTVLATAVSRTRSSRSAGSNSRAAPTRRRSTRCRRSRCT